MPFSLRKSLSLSSAASSFPRASSICLPRNWVAQRVASAFTSSDCDMKASASVFGTRAASCG